MSCIGTNSEKSLAAVVARMNRAGVANMCQSKQNVLQLWQFSSGMVSVTVNAKCPPGTRSVTVAFRVFRLSTVQYKSRKQIQIGLQYKTLLTHKQYTALDWWDAGFWPQHTGFVPRAVCVELCVDKVPVRGRRHKETKCHPTKRTGKWKVYSLLSTARAYT
jgi:hypothetical protein